MIVTNADDPASTDLGGPTAQGAALHVRGRGGGSTVMMMMMF
jgi:hypothetical protein